MVGYIAKGTAVYPTARQGECSSVPTYGKVRKMKHLLQSITIREIKESINTIKEFNMHNVRKRVVCADGFSLSVQASDFHYCDPRAEDADAYEAVEVGYPSEKEPLLTGYIEVPSMIDRLPATRQVYPYVPSRLVRAIILLHGGMVEGELPPGV